ncbi:leukocyte surface antigen CD53 [Nematolebias whitei]|uniref:leukocyte surface antigen CD53 n=1 Tax=Nematolebias whitei TaxID=451745 RepID=UPI00189C4A3A|nr:leukocyte surface antigen CD53 [Nematolebias whitei]
MAVNMTALTPSLANVNISNMLLISGIVITCVSFLGFLGALKENRCLLLTFFLLLFFLMLVELTAACLMLMYESELNKLIQKDLNSSLKKAQDQERNSTLQSVWDFVQNTFDCCGVHNATDWGENVPQSCCMHACEIPTPPYKTQGCLAKLNMWFENNFLMTGISVIVVCIIEVLGMCFAMTLFCHIRRSGLGYKL